MSLKRSSGSTPGIGSELPATPVDALNDLSDVDLVSTAPVDADHLVYDTGTDTEHAISAVDSSGEYNAFYGEAKAWDGDAGSAWQSLNPQNGYVLWFSADLGSAKLVDKIMVGQTDAFRWSDIIKVYYSDNGTAWTWVQTFNGQTSGNMTLELATGSSHRYWKVEEEGSSASEYWRIYEIEFYESGAKWVPVSSIGLIYSANHFDPAGSPSSSAFAWKGTNVLPDENVTIDSIIMYGAVISGATYQGAVMTESGGTVATITKTASRAAASTDVETLSAAFMLRFATPVALTAATEYFIMVGRTDSTDNYSLGIMYPSGRFPFPFAGLGTNTSARIAKAAPAVSDTVDFLTTSSVRLGVLWYYT